MLTLPSWVALLVIVVVWMLPLTLAYAGPREIRGDPIPKAQRWYGWSLIVYSGFCLYRLVPATFGHPVVSSTLAWVYLIGWNASLSGYVMIRMLQKRLVPPA